MTNDPDQIRADIERTRSSLGSDVDALADKVSPSHIVDRQTEAVKNKLGSVRDSIMGARDDAGGAVSVASDTVVQKAKGNPLAVGLIALGAGWLLSSLIPVSEKEKEVASKAKDAAQPLVDEVTDAAKGVAAELKEPATDAVNAVRDTATSAAENVKGEATSSAETVKSEASSSTETVKGSARDAKHTVQQQGS